MASTSATAPATPSPYEKFLAWARTVPMTLRNPLYHWTHLELLRYFDIDEPLDENTAPRFWEWANEKLATDDLRAHGILRKFSVRAVCTTDDPADDLAHHKAIAASGIPTKVFPTFRPDKAMAVHTPEAFAQWIARLEAVSNRSVGNFASFLDALKSRHDFFHQMGGRLSDHGINHVFADFPPESEAAAIYDRARAGQAASPAEYARFGSYLMLLFGIWDAERGWTKQLHIGAPPQQQLPPLPRTRPGYRFRFHRRLAANRRPGRLYGPPPGRKRPAQNGDLQPEPRR